jgi:hypothetical protein
MEVPMIVFDLMLTVCLASDASHCRTEHIYFENDGTEMQCMVRAQPHIARWMDSHPGFRVKRWECVNPDVVRKI